MDKPEAKKVIREFLTTEQMRYGFWEPLEAIGRKERHALETLISETVWMFKQTPFGVELL